MHDLMGPETMNSDILLEVHDLEVAFGKPDKRVAVVKGASLTIDRGETVALVGESGSGKTVTSLAVLGLIGKKKKTEKVSGRIMFASPDGQIRDLAQLGPSEMRRIQGNDIAMIFQEPMTALNPVLRIGEQIAEVLIEHQHMPKTEAWNMAAILLERVGIPDAGHRLRSYPHELSGGMRQRAMIAMALSCAPSLLIADEPTTALDVTIQAQILDLIAELKSESGSSVLFITHDLAVVSEIADRVIVMYSGVIVEQGTTIEVLQHPLHPYTRGLIACVPRISAEIETRVELQPIPGMVADPANPPAGCPFHPRCPYMVEGVCNTELPPLDILGKNRDVRCARWREIGEDA